MNDPMRLGSFLLVLLTIGWNDLPAQPVGGPGFIVLPFDNRSDFEEPWDLGDDVSRYLGTYLAARYGSMVVLPHIALNRAVELGLGPAGLKDPSFWNVLRKETKARFILTGSVDEFDVSRFTTGNDLLGGYESYKGFVSVTFTLYDLTRFPGSLAAGERSHGLVQGEHTDRSFTLTLLGKQTQRTVEYRQLNRIRFGSEEFNITVIGEACRKLAENLCLELELDVPMLRSRDGWLEDSVTGDGPVDTTAINVRGRIVRGSVLFVEGDEAFVSLGTLDGVLKGQTIACFDAGDQQESKPADEPVSLLVLTDVRGPHLSLARIQSGKDKIKAKMEVRARVIE